MGTERWTRALLLLALVAACSCAKQQVTYHDPRMDFGQIQTVAVLPFENLTTERAAADRVRDVFTTMLQATGGLYVLPPGEVNRGIQRTAVESPSAPTAEEIVALASNVGVDSVVTGVLREYGSVRSGTSSANIISVSVQLFEAETGTIVWSGESTKGGISAANRFFGSGGKPMNAVTQEAIDDLLDQLFK
jgi:hypothetical protein